jgi:hypothetical protein
MIGLDEIIIILEKHCNIPHAKATDLYFALLFHACGLNNSCNVSPLVIEAMKIAGSPEFKCDFASNFQNFMLMCLRAYKES